MLTPPDLPKLHDRNYHVESYRKGDSLVMIRGEIKDQKPPGVYFEGDPEPLTIHHMVVDLDVDFPSMEIVDATVMMESHPNPECRSIEGHYQKLVGLSIARGFTHKVRELFGGPRGCTHTTALLQAMAPVAVQSVWSLRSFSDTEQFVDGPIAKPTPAEMRERMSFNLNTCHVWMDGGLMFDKIDRGEEFGPPIWAEERMKKLGVDRETWMSRMRG